MLALLFVTATIALLSVLPAPGRRPSRSIADVLPVPAAGELALDLRRAWRREVDAVRAELAAVVERLWRDAVPLDGLFVEDISPTWIRFGDGTVLAVTSPSAAGLRIVSAELATGRRVTVSRIYFTGADTGALVRFDTTTGPVPIRATSVCRPT